MEAGDLRVAHGMGWHYHGHGSSPPIIRMDILSWHVMRFRENLPYKPYPDEQQTVGRTPGRDIFHPWSETYPALLHRAEQQHDPFDDILMEYVNPATGGSVRPTVACYLQLLRPGVRTRAHRETSCAVYRVV